MKETKSELLFIILLLVLFLRYVQGPAVSAVISQNFWKIPNQPKGSGIQEW